MTKTEFSSLCIGDFVKCNSFKDGAVITQKFQKSYQVKCLKSGIIISAFMPHCWTKLTEIEKVKLL